MRYSVIRLLLLPLLALSTGCDRSSIPGLAVRPIWIVEFNRLVASKFCDDENSIFRACFAPNQEECREVILSKIAPECYETEGADIPFFIAQPRVGRHWGQILGSCIGGQYHKIYAHTEKKTEECQRLVRNLAPRRDPLASLYQQHPSAKMIYDASDHYHNLFEQLAEAIVQRPEADFMRLYNRYLQVEASFVGRSPNAEIIRYYQVELEKRKAVHELSAPLCHRMFTDTSSFSEEDRQLLQVEMTKIEALKRNQAVIDDAVAAAITSPQIEADDQAVEVFFERALAGMPPEKRKKLLDDEEPSPEDGCSLSVALYEAILALPEEEAGPVLRGLHAQRITLDPLDEVGDSPTQTQ